MPKQTKKSISFRFTPKIKILSSFLEAFWFAPQDVLLRSVEANILQTIPMKHPILDVGVGDGSIAPLLYPKKLVIDHGFDVDPSGLERARVTKKYKKVTHDNAEKMSFKSGSFSTVICNSTCEHITKDAQAIKEMGRVLKKGGVLYLTVPSAYLPEMILDFERFEGNTQPKKALNRFNKRVAHKHYHTLDQWTKTLKSAHLTVSFSTYYFSKETTQTWYGLMKWSISSFLGREMWSWIGQSRLTPFIPQNIAIWFLQNIKLRTSYKKAFDITDNQGGMLFIVATKK